MKISDRLSKVIFEIFNKYSDDAIAEEKARNFIDSVGLDINSLSDEDGSDDPDSAMIHIAIAGNHDRVLLFLIKIGADIEVKTSINESPLNVAAIYDNELAMLTLLDLGADIESVDDKGYTPLLNACDNFASYVVPLLLERGANTKALSNSGNSVLHILPKWRNSKAVEVTMMVINNGADTNAVNNDGDNPLHRAAEYGNIDMVKLLVENGSDINAKNNNGNTPIDRARKYVNPRLPDGTDKYAAIVMYLESRMNPGALLNNA